MWTTPLYVTVEPDTKPVPVIVSVCATVPAATVDGDRPLIAGIGLLTGKLAELEAPPPGRGFVTTTALVPAVA